MPGPSPLQPRDPSPRGALGTCALYLGGLRRDQLALAPLLPASPTPEQKVKAEPGPRREHARCVSAGELLTDAGEPPAETRAGEGESWPWERAKETAGPGTGIHKFVLRARETAALRYRGVGGEEHSFPNADHSEFVFAAVVLDR